MLSWVSSALGYISNRVMSLFNVFKLTSRPIPPHPRSSSEMVCVGTPKTNKVVIVGDRAVGKSTFMNYLRNTAYNTPIQTIGYDFWIDKSGLNPSTKILVFYWDSGIGRTNGANDILHDMAVSPYGNMLNNDIFILVYDATWEARVSGEYVRDWLTILCRRPTSRIIIVGLRRMNQCNKPIHGLDGLLRLPDNVITECICDITMTEQATRVINYIKILCKNECFVMNVL